MKKQTQNKPCPELVPKVRSRMGQFQTRRRFFCMKLIRTITTLLTLLLCVATGCRPVQKEIPKQRFSRIDHVIEEEI